MRDLAPKSSYFFARQAVYSWRDQLFAKDVP